jgi:hypothetical protein
MRQSKPRAIRWRPTPAQRTCESLKSPATFQWQGQVKWEENHGLRGGRKQSLYDYPAVHGDANSRRWNLSCRTRTLET